MKFFNPVDFAALSASVNASKVLPENDRAPSQEPVVQSTTEAPRRSRRLR